MMERGVGKLEITVRDEYGVSRTLHVDPDATVESIHEVLRELTGVSRDTQVLPPLPLTLFLSLSVRWQLLTYEGQALYDRRTVHDYNIKPCSTVFLKRIKKAKKLEASRGSGVKQVEGRESFRGL